MRRAAVVAAIAWALALGVPGAAIAQDSAEAVITGVVAHGADLETFDPTALLVSLDVLEGVSPLAQLSTRPTADGTFAFSVAPAPTRTYFLSVEHQGARYSASRRADTLDDPVTLTVFDATSDPSVRRSDSFWPSSSCESACSGSLDAARTTRIRERRPSGGSSGRAGLPPMPRRSRWSIPTSSTRTCAS